MNKIEFKYNGREVVVWCEETDQAKYLGKYSITLNGFSSLFTANGSWVSCSNAIEIAKAEALELLRDGF